MTEPVSPSDKTTADLAALEADFRRYRMHAEKQRDGAHKAGREELVVKLLPALDNLERGLTSCNRHAQAGTDPKVILQAVLQGLGMVKQEIVSALAGYEIQPFEGEGPFDPQRHEAVTLEPSELPPGTVTRCMARGWTAEGKLLRPARVAVSQKKGA